MHRDLFQKRRLHQVPGLKSVDVDQTASRHQMKGMRRYLILDRYSPYPGSLLDRNLSSSRSLRRMPNTSTATLRSAQYEPSASAVPMRKRKAPAYMGWRTNA